MALCPTTLTITLSAADQAKHDSIWKENRSYSPEAVQMAQLLATYRRRREDAARNGLPEGTRALNDSEPGLR